MPDIVYVTPAKGGRVRMPDRGSTIMPAEGMFIERTNYYERLIASKDIVVDESKEFKPEKAAKAAAETSKGTRT